MARTTHHFKRIVTAGLAAVWFSAPAHADAARVDDLFEQLARTEGMQAARIAAEIGTEWSRSGSPAIDLLLRRGQRALDDGDTQAAIEHLTAAIDHDPAFTEAYNLRATAFYLADEIGPALADLRVVLDREPRHFGALRGFGIVLTELGREREALKVFRQVLALYPAEEETQAAVEELGRRIDGTPL